MMSWCPKCKVEYVDGIVVCADCGEPLVEKPEAGRGSFEAHGQSDPLVHLITVPSSLDADQLEALLKSNDIKTRRRLLGSGAYAVSYLGASRAGAQIYVPESCREKAAELLQVMGFDDTQMEELPEEEETEDDAIQDDSAYRRKRRIRAWIIVLLFVPGILWLMLGGAVSILATLGFYF